MDAYNSREVDKEGSVLVASLKHKKCRIFFAVLLLRTVTGLISSPNAADRYHVDMKLHEEDQISLCLLPFLKASDNTSVQNLRNGQNRLNSKKVLWRTAETSTPDPKYALSLNTKLTIACLPPTGKSCTCIQLSSAGSYSQKSFLYVEP
jgi:hypothetical protein